MTVSVKLFGMLADAVGKQEMKFENVADAFSLVERARKEFPAIADKKFGVAVNRKLVRENQPLKAGDEIAFLPPYSGG